MATDYVFFLHGVNVRDPNYANSLIQLIEARIKDSGRSLKSIPVFWGKLKSIKNPEKQLLKDWSGEQVWPKLWFKNLRQGALLNFAGDAALYMSPHISEAINECILKTWQNHLPEKPDPDDRLHFVTHSLGTVILFDLLFSSRWDAPSSTFPSSYQIAQRLRQDIYGISPQDPALNPAPSNGLELRSITTMGSPISFFSLINNAARMQTMLQALAKRVRSEEGMGNWKLPWQNYLHPGDPVGSPLRRLLQPMIDQSEDYLCIEDFLVPCTFLELLTERLPINILDFFAWLVNWNTVSVLDGVNAHASYWACHIIARDIAKAITLPPP